MDCIVHDACTLDAIVLVDACDTARVTTLRLVKVHAVRAVDTLYTLLAATCI